MPFPLGAIFFQTTTRVYGVPDPTPPFLKISLGINLQNVKELLSVVSEPPCPIPALAVTILWPVLFHPELLIPKLFENNHMMIWRLGMGP